MKIIPSLFLILHATYRLVAAREGDFPHINPSSSCLLRTQQSCIASGSPFDFSSQPTLCFPLDLPSYETTPSYVTETKHPVIHATTSTRPTDSAGGQSILSHNSNPISISSGSYSNSISPTASPSSPQSDVELGTFGTALASPDSIDSANPQAIETTSEVLLYDDGDTQYFRSKDAGKTCKERFSYCSFDAGATVLKTSRGAKNAKAILTENKDTYMLLECRESNKYLIVELSDDILLDTVVIANFEFFSSMIRHFRVSVSDRYPVKIDKWKDLGTFEARNSRDIQPFLVKNPQIWARYVRVEFLSHYGNEFYCPVSLLRVHGTRMLETWKETDGGRDEEDNNTEKHMVDDVLHIDEPSAVRQSSYESQADADASCLRRPMPLFLPTCSAHNLDAGNHDLFQQSPAKSLQESSQHLENQHSVPPVDGLRASPQALSSNTDLDSKLCDLNITATGTSSHEVLAEPTTQSRNSEDVKLPVTDHIDATLVTSKGSESPTSTSTKKSSSSPVLPVASPTVQDSFFKSVARKLSSLESNMSTSLRELDTQCRSLHELYQETEQAHQITIDARLHDLRQHATDQLSLVEQSNSRALKSFTESIQGNHDQLQQQIFELSSRLNILADEVVFQKRMAAVQAILLLGCLTLLVFTRHIPQYLPPLTNSYQNGGAEIMEYQQSRISIQHAARNNAYGVGVRENASAKALPSLPERTSGCS